MNLPELFKAFLLAQKKKPSEATLKNYLADVRQFISWYEQTYSKPFHPSLLNKEVIEAYTQAKNISATSLQRHISSLRKFAGFLQTHGYLSTDPFAQIASESKKLNTDPWQFLSFKTELKQAGASDLTIKNYLSDLGGFISWIKGVLNEAEKETNPLSHLTPNLLTDYQRYLAKTFSQASAERKLSSLRRYLKFVQEKGLIEDIAGGFYSVFNSTSTLQRREDSNEPHNEIASSSSRNDTSVLESMASSKIEHPKSKTYSSFPPLRLLQKTKALVMLGFDATAVALTAVAVEKIQYLSWLASGKQVFVKSAKKVNGLTGAGVNGLFKKSILSEFVTTFTRQPDNRISSLHPAHPGFKNLPAHHRMLGHVRYTRPTWYHTYHSYRLTSYFHLAALVIMMTALTFGMYNALFADAQKNKSLAAPPTAPPRVLSFQGRLTDSSDNPINSAKALRFAIYNDQSASGSALLWQEVQSVTPDADGIFSVYLGNSTAIPASVFANNSSLYLGVTVETDPELAPRQQIATVGFAANSETLQGLLPITAAGAGTNNVVLALDSSGNLTIGGSATPTFQATGGAFTLSGNVLNLSTTAGSNSNVNISPDGLGTVNITKPIQNTSLNNNIPSAAGAVEVDDMLAVLATSSGQSALTLNQNGAGPILSASASGNAKFSINNSGVITANSYGAGVAQFDASGILSSSPLSLSGTLVSGILPVTKGGTGINGVSTGDLLYGSASNTISTLPIGTTGKVLTVSGGLPSWVDPSLLSGSNFWQLNNGALAPLDINNDLLLGGNSTSSAKFAFLNNNGTGTPTASISGNFSIQVPTGTNPSTKLNILNGGSFNIQTATAGQGDAGLSSRLFILNNGNIGIGSTNPTQKLDVAGNIAIAANSTFDTNAAGTLTIGGATQTGLTIGRTGTTTSVKGSNITNGGIGYGASNTLTFTGAGTAGQPLLSGGAGAPTFGTLGLVYGGTNTDLSGVATGGLIYKGASALAGTGALTGVLKGNGSGAPTAMNGTANYVTRWTDANTLGIGILYDNGTNVGIGSTSPLAQLDVEEVGNSKGIAIFNGDGNQTLFTASISGTTKFIVDRTGNVGIGTITPGATLDVVGTARISGVTTLSNYTTNGGLLYANGSGVVAQTGAGTGTQCLLGGTTPTWGACSTGGGITGSGTTNYIAKFTGTGSIGNSLLFDNGTNVGIGTTNPQYLLDINGTGHVNGRFVGNGVVLNVGGGGQGQIYPVNNANLNIMDYTDTNTLASFTQSGNVGIGSTAPAQKLDVNGSIATNTNVYFGTAGSVLAGTNQGGSIELGPTNSAGSETPFIDFHYGVGSAQDYNFRVINAGDKLLNFTPNGMNPTLSLNGANVGIGSTLPGTALDVAGSIRTSAQFLGTTSDSASAPSFSWNGDTNLGLFHAGTDVLGITTGGVERMRVASNGNVGIGTTTTAEKLYLSSGNLGIDANNTSNVGLLYYKNGTNYQSNPADPRNSGIITALSGQTGRLINQNPDFLYGLNGYGTYDNSGGGHTTIALTNIATAPNSTGMVMDIHYDGAGTPGTNPTPGYGGFLPNSFSKCSGTNGSITTANCYREGERILERIWAKIPVGYNIASASNGIGTGSSQKWLTSQAGTGNWQEYILLTTIGEGGSLGTTGHKYLSDAGGGNVALDWYVADYEARALDEVPTVDRAQSLNIGFASQSAQLGFGQLLTTKDAFLAISGGNVGIGTTTTTSLLDVNKLFNVTSAGNVGIGSTAPAYKLDVQGGSGIVGQFSGRVIGGNAVNSNEFVTLGQLSSGAGQYWQLNSGALSPSNITNDVLVGGIATSSALVRLAGLSGQNSFFNTGGNLGIGTTTPSSLLHLAHATVPGSGADTKGILIENTAANSLTGQKYSLDTGVVGVNDAYFGIQDVTNNAYRLVIKNDGNIGIGSTLPGAKLDINGGAMIENGNSLTLQPTSGSGGTIFSPSSGRLQFGISGGDSFEARSAGLMFPNGNYIMDQNGNAMLQFGLTASAVNNFTITSAATGNAPSFSATGSDTNIGMKLDGKGSGNLLLQTVATGNVGIGSTAPTYSLDVNGTLRASSTSNAVFGNGTTGGIQLGDGTITKTSGSAFQMNSGLTMTQNLTVNGTGSNYFAGNVGIGTTSPTAPLQLEASTTQSSSVAVPGGLIELSATPTTTGSPYYQTFTANLRANPTSGVTIQSPDQNDYGVGGGVIFNGIGTLQDAASVQASSIFYNTGTVNSYEGFRVHGPNQGGSATITNAYGLYLGPMKTAGLVTNGYGIYQQGASDNNYFAGNVGIGVNPPTYNLAINGSTNTTSLYLNGSQVTSTATEINYLHSLPVTAGGVIYTNGSTLANTGAGTGTQCLLGGTTPTWGACSTGGGITGSGTTNYIAKFTGTGSIGNSLLFDNGTNVGIGTTTPGSKFNIVDSSFSLNASNATGLQVETSQSTAWTNLGTNGPSLRILEWYDSGNNPLGTIDGVGNVGIGTISPLAKLDLQQTGNSKAIVNINGDGNQTLLTASVSGTTKFIVDKTGNVGIGSSTPGANLDVVGTARVSGVTTFSNYTTNGGLLYTNGSGVIAQTGAGTSGQALISGGAGAPSYGTLGLVYGGTNADLSGVATGGLIYKGATALAGTGALTGVLKGNGSGAPTAMNGTANYVTRWTDANTLGIGILYDNGTNVGIGTTVPLAKLDVRGQGVFGVSGAGYAAPLASNSAEFNISSNSLVTIGESVAGNANPQITLYRTASGLRSGRASRIYSPDSLGTLQFDISSNGNLPYGAETYNNIMTLKSTGNVGIGSSAPGATLDVVGTARISGVTTLSNYTTNGGLLYTNGSGVVAQTGAGTGTQCLLGGTTPTWGACSTGGGVTGSGTTNYLAKFTGTSAIGNSLLFDNGTNVGIGTITPAEKLDVSGTAIASALVQRQGVTDVAAGASVSITGGSLSSGGPTNRGGNSYWNVTATGQQIVVDLGASVGQVNAVSFGTFWRTDGTAIPANYTLEYSTDNVTYTNIATVTGNTSTSVYHSISGAPTVRYIRLTVNAFQSGQSSAKVAGIQVFTIAYSALAGSNVWGSNPGVNSDNIYLATAGNVGIGSTAPAAKLDVAGGINANSESHLSSGAYSDPASGFGAGLKVSGNFAAGGTSAFMGGNVGIGITNPAGKLDITPGASSFGIRGNGAAFPSNTMAYIAASATTITPLQIDAFTGGGQTADMLRISSSASNGDLFIIKSNGNIGIGSTLPAQKLDVSGNIQGSGVALLGSGGNTAPSYSFTSDSNTGMYDITTDVLGFATGGTERMRIASNGNVGVGTTSTGNRLNVFGSGNTTVDLNVNGRIQTGDANNNGGIWLGSAQDAFVGQNGSANIGFWTTAGGWSTLNIVKSNGNVGIGSSLPTQKLDVNGYVRGATGLCINTDCRTAWPTGSITGSGSTNYLAKWSSSTGLTNSLLYDTGTNVGIGSTSPTVKLDVAGNGKFNNLQVDASLGYDQSIYFTPQPYFEAGSTTAPFPVYVVDGFTTVNDTNVPFSKVALSNNYNQIYSDFIPVQPGDQLYGEMWAERDTGATGTAGLLYYGVEEYDEGKLPIATNNGTNYFVASGQTVASNSTWTKYSGTITLPTSHTPYNGSDGGPVRYVRVRILVNYNTGTIPTRWGGIVLRRVAPYRDSGNVVFNGNVGIGTATPNAPLQITSSGNTVSLYASNFGCGAGYVGIGVNATLSGCNTYSLLGDGTNTFLNAPSGGNVYLRVNNSSFATGNAAAFNVSATSFQVTGAGPHYFQNGNVGIGSTVPAQKLDVSGAVRVSGGYGAPSAGGVLTLGGGGTSPNGNSLSFGDNTGWKFNIGTNASGTFTPRVTFQDNGNVGIGSTAPGTTLDVTGTARISGVTTLSNYTTNGGLLYTNASGVISQTAAGSSTTVLHGGTTPSYSAVSLTADVSGILPVGNGGMGVNTLTTNGVLYGGATVGATTAGTAGQLLLGQAGAPSFQTMGGDATISNTGTLSLKATGTAGTYGSASQVPVFTTDAQGRVTGVTNTSIAISAGQVTSGILAIAQGGTNANTVGAAGSVAYSTGSAYAFSAAGSSGNCLMSGGTGAPTWGACSTGSITGSGTTNFIPKFTPSGTALGNSLLYDTGTNIGIGTTVPLAKLDVTGDASVSGNLTFGSNAAPTIQTSRNTSLTIGGSTTGDIIINPSSTNNVGIGMSTPGSDLQINGTAAIGYGTTATTGPTNGLAVNGNVGIGSTAPGTKLDVNGDIRFTNTRSVTLTRSIPTTLNNEVDIGTFTFTNGGASLDINITVPSSSYSVAKHYLLPIQYAQAPNNTWVTALPISNTGPFGSNDFALDVNVNNGTASLRLRNTGGTTANTAYITIMQQGVATDGFAASSATSAVSAPTQYFTSTALTQTGGNVGIGLITPGATLDISGTLRASGQTTLSNYTTNGGLLYTNGSGVVAQTGAGSITTVLHGGATPSYSAVSLTSDVSGILPVGNGGTGVNTLTTNGVLYGGATVGATTAGTAGQLLLGQAGAPSFQTMGGDATISNTGTLSLKATGTAGTYGSASQVPQFTTDAQGRVTAVTNTSIAIAASAITSGTLPILRGGTNATAIGSNGSVAYSNGTNYAFTGVGSSGNCLLSAGAASPTWGSCITGAVTSTGTTNFIAKFTGSGTVGNSLLFDSGTNVGIGTTVPLALLDLQQTGNSKGIVNINGDGNQTLFTASTSGTTQFIIDKTGNVGIGLAAPGADLQLNGGMSIGYGTTGTAAPANGLTVNGNVGIGGTTASQALYVTGNAQATGVFFAGAGSVGTPAYTFGGDPNTGMYDIALDTLGFATNGAERVRIASNGNVGIGTTTVNSLLDVAQNVGTGLNVLRVDMTDSSAHVYNFAIGAATTRASLGLISNNDLGIGTNNSFSQLYLQASGNIGIGTTSPTTAKLVINNGAGGEALDLSSSDSYANLRVLHNTNGSADKDMYIGYNSGATSSLHLYSNNSETLTVKTGNVGIGSATPGEKLDVAGNMRLGGGTRWRIFTVDNRSGASNSCDSATSGTVSQLCIDSGLDGASEWTVDSSGNTEQVGTAFQTGNPDIAEHITKSLDENIDRGDILMAGNPGSTNTGNQYRDVLATRSTTPYASNVIGIVSSKPSILAGLQDSSVSLSDTAVTPTAVAITVAGRIPTKVSTINGPIQPGDPITSSQLIGVGMKATRAGTIVGHALQAFTGSNDPQATYIDCPAGTDPSVKCGEIMVLLNVSWYDPDVYITDAGTLSITGSGTSVDDFKAWIGQYQTDRKEAFSDAVIAHLIAGLVNTQQLIVNGTAQFLGTIQAQAINAGSVAVNSLTVGGQTLSDYILSVVQNAGFSKQTGIVSPVDQIATGVISPLDGQTLTVNGNLAIKKTASAAGSLSVDGNASISGTLSAQDATISGTLHAHKISADEIEGLDAKIASLSANSVTATSAAITNITNITNVYNTASGSATPSASGSATPATQSTQASGSAMLNGATPSLTSYAIQSNYADIGSLSAALAYVPNLNADFGTFNQGLISLGSTSLADTSIAGQLSINGSFILSDNSINTLGATLEIQPLRQGNLSFMAGLMTLDTDGNLSVGGNATFAKNVTVNGNLAAKVVSPVPDSDLIFQLPGSSADQSTLAIDRPGVVVKNASGSSVLKLTDAGDVIASGAGQFSNLQIIRGAQADTSFTTTVASGSAGTASIVPGETSRTIVSPFVGKDSLIYITATSDTGGIVPYVARQVAEDKAHNVQGSFTIQIPQASAVQINVNWWIVN